MNMDTAREIHQEFSELYLKDLINFAVFVQYWTDEEVYCASGVLVNVKGRHFVATAEHCVRKSTELGKSVVPVGRVGSYASSIWCSARRDPCGGRSRRRRHVAADARDR